MATLVGGFGTAIALLLIPALYCILVSRNLIRILIGVELLSKPVTLLLIIAGYATGRIGIAEAMVITLIIIEVVVVVVAAGILIGVFQQTESLDARELRSMKG